MKKVKDLHKDNLRSCHLIIKKLIKRPHIPDTVSDWLISLKHLDILFSTFYYQLIYPSEGHYKTQVIWSDTITGVSVFWWSSSYKPPGYTCNCGIYFWGSISNASPVSRQNNHNNYNRGLYLNSCHTRIVYFIHQPVLFRTDSQWR